MSDSCAHDLDHIREFQVIIEINQTFNHFISKGCEKHFVTAGSFLKGYLVMWEKYDKNKNPAKGWVCRGHNNKAL